MDTSTSRTPGESKEPVTHMPMVSTHERLPLILRLGGFIRAHRAVTYTLAFSLLFGIALFITPFKYVISSPGPTWNVIDTTKDDKRLIEITDAKTYPTNGALMMTTVSSQGGPGSYVTGAQVIIAAFSPSTTVTPLSELYPENVTRESISRISDAQMVSSQTTAEAIALGSLGYTVPARIAVQEVPKTSPAYGLLMPGDVLTSLAAKGKDTVTLSQFDSLFTTLRTIEGGQTVTLGVRRGNVQQYVDVKVQKSTKGEGSELGIYINPKIDLPLKIQFHLEGVGGPSAGTMFALGIVDELTPGSLTGGKKIAGTGALALDGRVQAISGIPQKMTGAKRDGADWFLAPAGNCDEVPGNIPKGLHVVKVSTFDEARTAVEAIAKGEGETLPSCDVAGKS
ncbi:MAG: S16 family serine protease [Actinomycetaceae bacterium]|nr:S16 family serine protease [Actinomycetaceae bacterium]